MAYRTITADPLTPRIGAIISGVDLTAPLNPEQIEDLHQAIADHQVIFFHNQPLDPASLKRLGQHFGNLQAHALKGLPDHPEVRKLHADETSKHVAGEEWHSDMTCAKKPPMGSILYLHTLPTMGGDTAFSSMYAAYDALSDRMKAYLEGLTAVHDGRLAFGRFDPTGQYPIATHPVIRVHPVTGKKVLFVNKGFTSHINELPPAESQAVLDFLYRHVENAYFQCRFKWEQHSVAFWDNRCTQHLAIWDYYPQVRSGFRVQIEDVPGQEEALAA
ncbi:TauD/TfdA dioxygenase family protein [Sphingomonas turrisvirgatae]|uniref:Taurine dioxygenase n=1 Tax=Sphingomonas turrisvirgatae TaxID=1888892 RepID=A0A1E3LS40_9SPHN|nr:TauD/TfdA family dioxygenase [Sphingomonas turrisvirgatae]ODP36553.1 taurine dioxygenase [Sphingomonas turrisvirgatae]